jgi:hypothetical protein
MEDSLQTMFLVPIGVYETISAIISVHIGRPTTHHKNGRRIPTQQHDLKKNVKKKFLCIIRESNTGLVDGNDEFYH